MDKRTNALSGTRGRLALVAIAFATLSACSDGGNDSNPSPEQSKSYSIGGTINGLTGTVVLRWDSYGFSDESFATNGAFTFAEQSNAGNAYNVIVVTQPSGQTCSVANGAGTANTNVTNVAVTCTTNASYTVGGNVSGLGTGLSVVLRNNGGDDLTVNANGAFTFATPVVGGLPYAVTVLTQPTGQTCSVSQGSGTVAAANVTSVTVACVNNPPPTQSYAIGGTISGLSGTLVMVPFSYGDPQTFTTNGAFTFSEQTAAGNLYHVTIETQPSGQTCTVTNGSGTVNANVTNVSVNCSANTTDYSIGGTITGLTGAGLKIEDTSANAVTVPAGATTFTLPNRKQSNYEYDVGISAQPAGQTCVLLKSHGVINSADVANVDVRCIDNVTDPIVGTYTVPALSASNTSYVYITLFADGVYIYGSVENNGTNCGTTNGGNGVEYGVYNYNATTHAFTIKSAVVDTNGGCGVWNGAARYTGTLTKAGTGQSTVLTLTLPGDAGQFDLVPVASTTGQIIGSWGNPHHKAFFVFLPAGGNNLYSFFAETQADTAPTSTGREAGIEYACGSVTALTGGTYTADFNPATCQAPAPSQDGPVDTNGTAGISGAGGPVPVTITVDTLTSADTWTRIKPN